MPAKRTLRTKNTFLDLPSPEVSDLEDSDVPLSEDDSSSDYSMPPVSPKAPKGKNPKKSTEAVRVSEWEQTSSFDPGFDFGFKGERASYEAYSSKHELPVTYFKHFLSDSMFNTLAESSNKYSMELTGRSAEITKQEIEQYFGN